MSSKNSIVLYKYDEEEDCYYIRTCDTTKPPYKISNPILLNNPPLNKGKYHDFRVFLINNNQQIIYPGYLSTDRKSSYWIGTINYEKGIVEDVKPIKGDYGVDFRKVFEFQDNDNVGFIVEMESVVRAYDIKNGNPEKTVEIKPSNYQTKISLIYQLENGSKWYACLEKENLNFFNLEEQLPLQKTSKPTFQIKIPFQEPIKNTFFNTNKQLLYIITDNSLYHYDMVNKVFLHDLTINVQPKTQFNFINAQNQLVILNKGYQTDIYTLSFKKSKWYYSKKISIDNLRCLNIDFKKADQNIKYVLDQENKTAFILENFFEFEENIYQHYSAFRLSSLIGFHTNGSAQKLDSFHYQNLKRQPIHWQTLEIQQLNQKFTLYDDIENQIIGFIQQSYHTQDIINQIILFKIIFSYLKLK